MTDEVGSFDRQALAQGHPPPVSLAFPVVSCDGQLLVPVDCAVGTWLGRQFSLCRAFDLFTWDPFLGRVRAAPSLNLIFLF